MLPILQPSLASDRGTLRQLDLEDPRELDHLNRLGHVPVEARLRGLLVVTRRAVAREGNENDLPSRLCPHAPRELVAVHAGKPDVEHGNPWALPSHYIEGRRPIAGPQHTMALQFERDTQALTRVGIVFDDENRLGTSAQGRHRVAGQGLGCLDGRQAHREGSARTTAFALHRDVAAVEA